MFRKRTDSKLAHFHAGTIEAKTDRLGGIVNFKKHQSANDRLNDWSHNVANLMSLVQKLSLIHI